MNKMFSDLAGLKKIVEDAAAEGSVDEVETGVWNIEDGKVGVQIDGRTKFVLARSHSWESLERTHKFLATFCPAAIRQMLLHIDHLQRLLAESQEQSAQQLMSAAKFQMDVAQIVNDFKQAGQLYEPDELWPKDDTRTSIIEILKMVVTVYKKLYSYYDSNDGMSPGACGDLAMALKSLFTYEHENEV